MTVAVQHHSTGADPTNGSVNGVTYTYVLNGEIIL
jgi:hypothetical protein